MSKRITVVIGKNFGDEGKGLAVDYFAGLDCGAPSEGQADMRGGVQLGSSSNELSDVRADAQTGEPSGELSHAQIDKRSASLVIKHNGGAQAGHTVDRRDKRFVFHQLSSGSFHGVPTFLSETFLPDLLKMPGEAESFRMVSGQVPPIYVDARCRLTTVFDVVLNAFAESERGKARHGSCGMGIHETVLRNRNPEYALSLEEFAAFSPCEAGLFLEKIRTGYVPARLRELSLKMRDGDRWCQLLQDSNVALNAADAMKAGLKYISIIRDAKALLPGTEHLIFEGAQGLLLDRNNRSYMPYLTPSDTGSINPSEILKACGIPFGRDNTEVCYVTRSYVTRHGAGPLPHECEREDIAFGIRDETNAENPWQESLRFARHPMGSGFSLAAREDLKYFGDATDRELCTGARVSLMVTHLNETGGKIVSTDGDTEAKIDPDDDGFRSFVERIYTSDTPYAADIRRIR